MMPTDTVYLDNTVIAAAAPDLQSLSAPARVRRGDPIPVTAVATDNRAVARVTFTVGAQTVTATAPVTGSTYAATLDSAPLAAGSQTLVVRAFDPGGRQIARPFTFDVFGGATPRLRPFTPLFVTQAGPGRRLGRLVGIATTLGVPNGARLRLVCVKGCSRKVVTARTKAKGKRLRITLSRPLRLRGSTRIELQLSLAGRVTRYQRYRFRRSSPGTLARPVSSGCLAGQRPRKTTPCPR
jgi:hypothetical protein